MDDVGQVLRCAIGESEQPCAEPPAPQRPTPSLPENAHVLVDPNCRPCQDLITREGPTAAQRNIQFHDVKQPEGRAFLARVQASDVKVLGTPTCVLETPQGFELCQI